MSNNVFMFNNETVTAIRKDDGIWFVAADVCRVLGIQNNRDALSRLDNDEKGVVTTDTPGGQQQVAAINESGVYHLIFKSRKPAARDFRRRITKEVIPSIRAHGGYVVGMEKLSGKQREQTVQTLGEEAARVAGVNATEEREARRVAFGVIRGRLPVGY